MTEFKARYGRHANKGGHQVTESDTATESGHLPLAGGTVKESITIAMETSSRMGSIAVGIGDRCLQEHTFSGPMQHATELLPAVELLMDDIGFSPADIGVVAVSIGPGSFTGVRIAVMAARTLSQVLGCRLVGVPTTEVLALNAPQDGSVPIGVVLDARRGMIFAACYQWVSASVEGGAGGMGPVLQTLLEPTLGDPKEILARWPRNIQLLGEGIAYHRDAIDGAGLDSRVLEPATAVPRAAALYRLGRWRADRGEFTARDALLPLYLRKPEAQELWEARHGESQGQG